MDKADDCPICRKKVKRISKNHIVNNIIEVYLRNNPDKKRSEEELKKLDEKTKITDEMVKFNIINHYIHNANNNT